VISRSWGRQGVIETKEPMPEGREGEEEDHAEATALEMLQRITEVDLRGEGSACLADGEEHSWVEYDGARGTGRSCEKCFTCQDAQGVVQWRIQPIVALPRATVILAAWQAELDRLLAGGCMQGGEHEWRDAQQTFAWIMKPGHCCGKCGSVVDAASGDVIMRPGLVGLFGLPQGPTYRGGAHPVWHNIAPDTAH
jgi:hypothetical protein